MIPILHLRQASGHGGGADTVLAQWLARAAGSRETQPLVLYLHKPGRPVTALAEPLRRLGVPVIEAAGGMLSGGQWRRALKLIDEHGVRVLHSHDPKSDLLAWLLRRARPDLRILATLHGWTRRKWKNRLYERLDRLVLARFDLCHAVSDSVAAEARGIRRIEVIRNGVDTDAWRPAPTAPEHPFTVAFVGRFSDEKGPLRFVAVARRLAAMGVAARFIMAGDGPERAATEQAAQGLDIRFPGMVPREALPAIYAETDVLLLTSRTEGLPMAVLEAAAMGIPTVATRVGGVPEAIRDGDTGLLAPLGDDDALAAGLRLLHDDPAERRAMGARARALVAAEFSVAAGWRRLEGLYRRLAETGR